MSVIICRTCGLEQSLPEGQDVLCCPACGTNNSRPQAVGESLDKLQRATRLRLAREYAEAETCYRHVLLDVDEHEALWGKLLCQYGVEFVCEAASGRRYPVVHIPQVRPLQETSDFEQACALAPEDVRRQYEADAAYIDEAQAEIRCLAETCPPYDVFLCHKTTLADGEGYTKDYVRADELYTWLKGEGYRVFFAPKEMPAGIAGANYEAMIYHALHTAKVMLVICSDAQNISATWVQSEWQRYLTRVDKREGRLAPLLYGGFSAARLPREFTRRKLEAVTMESLGAQSALLALVEKCCDRQSATVSATQEGDSPVTAIPPERLFSIRQVNGGVAITRYSGPGGAVSIPSSIHHQQVVEIANRAFVKQSALKSVIIPRGVTAIGGEAFWGCSGLENVILPDSLTSIGSCAFSRCSGLSCVTIPASVSSIGVYAFDGCGALYLRVYANSEAQRYAQASNIPYELTDPAPAPQPVAAPPPEEEPLPVMDFSPDEHFTVEQNGIGCVITKYTGPGGQVNIPPVIGRRMVVGIGARVFSKMASVTGVSIPSGVRSIGDFAFFKTGLRELTLPHGLQMIGEQAFDTITTLTAVDIPGTVKSMGKWVFERCTALKTVTIREGVAAIPYGAFMDCPALSDVSIPGSVEVIEEAAFQGDAGLTNVVIAPGVKHIHDNVFRGCTKLAQVTLPEGLESIGDGAFIKTGLRSVTLPQGLQSIGKQAFDSIEALTAVDIPGTVKTIGKGAFERCAALKTVVIREGVTAIPYGAFMDCPALTDVSIPGSVEVIEEAAFQGDASLTSVTIAPGVKHMHANVFRGCRQLACLTLPEGLESIGDSAFYEAVSLAEVNIPGSVTVIEQGAFIKTGLRSVTLPQGLQSIGKQAFDTIATLTAVDIPGTVKTIGKGAFERCAALKTVVIREGVTAIPYGAFMECPSLTEVSIPGSVEVIEEAAFQGDASLTNVTIAPGVKHMHANVFRGCRQLARLTLPEGMESIGRAAFCETAALTTLVVPETVRSIGPWAFSRSDLRRIRLPRALSDIDGTAFDECPDVVLYVWKNSPAHIYAQSKGLKCAFISGM